MYRHSNVPLSEGRILCRSYQSQVCAANAVADLLQRTRPYLSEKVSALQTIITRCQGTLDKTEAERGEAELRSEYETRVSLHAVPTSVETRLALNELDEATRALLDLRRDKQRKK